MHPDVKAMVSQVAIARDAPDVFHASMRAGAATRSGSRRDDDCAPGDVLVLTHDAVAWSYDPVRDGPWVPAWKACTGTIVMLIDAPSCALGQLGIDDVRVLIGGRIAMIPAMCVRVLVRSNVRHRASG